MEVNATGIQGRSQKKAGESMEVACQAQFPNVPKVELYNLRSVLNGFSSVDFSVLSVSGWVASVPRDRQQSCSLLFLASPCGPLPRWLPTLEELGCGQLFPHLQSSFMFISSLFLMRGQDLSVSSQKDPPFMILRKKSHDHCRQR